MYRLVKVLNTITVHVPSPFNVEVIVLNCQTLTIGYYIMIYIDSLWRKSDEQ